ncbi:thioredoxin [Candidatus Dojkabacteria bacterium]|uniref:Thioredoxin n=1 Tax=Candidatus Dojkabacteria bacterium TaxID=2099670 RepID=A0A955L4D6_9BACT|nr:thioredoxin [Candidatus Dojkabacteria bacterium]
MAKVFTDDNFQEEVLDNEGLSIVDYWAPWCTPCRIQGPIMEDIAEQMPEINIGKLNVDENPTISARYGIMSIPTLKFFKNGQEVAEMIGLQSKDTLLAKINELK